MNILNVNQRNFRKQMKQLQKEGKGKEEVYSYRFETERPRRRYKRRLFTTGGVIGGLFLAWNMFALSTWINPNHSNSTKATHLVTIDSKQEEISQYIQFTDELNKELTKNANELLVGMQQNNSITDEELVSMSKMLMEKSSETKTDLQELRKLEEYNSSQSQAVILLIQYVMEYKNTKSNTVMGNFMSFYNTYAKNSVNSKLFVLEVLKNQGMDYEIQKDGSISYKIKGY